MRVGIFFGGLSREREISFAGGRTVFDLLDKSRFQPVPIFVDSVGRLILLHWPNLYKGSIRDFYPPAAYTPHTALPFQYYAEQLYPELQDHWTELMQAVGRPLSWEELPQYIDAAFLTLHGLGGEDGSLQGMLEWLGIPYTGSGLYGSAVGMDKQRQKQLMQLAGFSTPAYAVVQLAESAEEWHAKAAQIGYPLVVKHPTQGSSIGVRIVQQASQLADAIWQCSFRYLHRAAAWHALDEADKLQQLHRLTDIRHSLGLPLYVQLDGEERLIHRPDVLLDLLNSLQQDALLRAADSTDSLLLEAFVAGREFSVIVIEQPDGSPLALPPTEIIKGAEVFDYRSKYLPGMSRKLTPIRMDAEALGDLCRQAEALKDFLGIEVYARLDGLIDSRGRVYFNDPNTTSGMLPSSFFFHQAAEVGLHPSQFLTYILQRSLQRRAAHPRMPRQPLATWQQAHAQQGHKLRVGVLLGGYSSERHISVESGRNIYEKLSASTDFAPIPIFVLDNLRAPASLGLEGRFSLWQLPIHMLLKDNADDIADRILNGLLKPESDAGIAAMRQRAEPVRALLGAAAPVPPRLLQQGEWRQVMDFAFIALHGRPGEDGTLQALLEQAGIPYNGSPVPSSQITIDKYATTELLMQAGLRAARHQLVHKAQWQQDPEAACAAVEATLPYPLIAKPHDEGCSSAVKRIKTREELVAYASLMFRTEDALPAGPAQVLNLKAGEEFPHKDTFLVEHLIQAQPGERFMEVTVGLLTHREAGVIRYEVFEPSEALATGEVLSLEEKFLAGEGQNITPARFSSRASEQAAISQLVRQEIEQAARLLGVEGYARIDAFVHIPPGGAARVSFIEVNSLPGMTPATCIFHQTALVGYTPLDFMRRIIAYGQQRMATLPTAP
ncbi:MAG: D-alanine--D-alanine ligase [Sphingobacteriia bacterium]